MPAAPAIALARPQYTAAPYPVHGVTVRPPPPPLVAAHAPAPSLWAAQAPLVYPNTPPAPPPAPRAPDNTGRAWGTYNAWQQAPGRNAPRWWA
eukprot:12856334-Heterocapsa_arctica.AAC.1